jgi:hypothetical protein
MARYSEDLDMAESYEQDQDRTSFIRRSFSEPPDQEYNDPPCTPRQAEDNPFLSQQGQPPLGYDALSLHGSQTQETGRLQGPEGSGVGVYTDALYEDRNLAQSSSTQHFQHMTAYSTNRFGHSLYSGLPQGSYPQTIDANLTEDDPDPNWYHGGKLLKRDDMAPKSDSASLQIHSNRQTSSFRTDLGPYTPYHGAGGGIPNETRFPLSSNPFASNNATAYPAPRATNDGQDLTPVYMRQPLEHQHPDTSNPVSREPDQMPLDSVYTGPWSPFQPANANQSPQYLGQHRMIGRHEISETTRSMYSGDINYSSYTMPEGVTTPLSSINVSNSHMGVNMTTGRAHNSQLPETSYQTHGAAPYRMVPDYAPLSLFQLNLERPATPRIGVRPSFDEYPQWEPGSYSTQPMIRKHSSAYSCSTDASSHGLPPTDDPDILYCDQAECSSFFTGIYRRGNLGRHRRQQHKYVKLYVCDDNTCAREFKRSDARVKHYRKHHPELASEYVPRPQIRRLRGDQDDDLRNISGWT